MPVDYENFVDEEVAVMNRGNFIGTYGLKNKPNHRTPVHEKDSKFYDIFDREIDLKNYTKRG